jgi:kinesin family protein 18/19
VSSIGEPETKNSPVANDKNTFALAAAKPGKKVAALKTNAAKKFLKADHHDHNMVVAVRLRPMTRNEVQSREIDIISLQDKMIVVLDKVELENMENDKKPDVLHRSKEMRYFFDRIFGKKNDTAHVYKETCAHLIPSVIKGYNACVFAYGTTGSGKTHTMTGLPQQPGIMFLILRDLFLTVKNETER